MKIIIRADASHSMGIGHVKRCLVLANQLKQRGNDVIFMHDEAVEGHMGGDIRASGYAVIAPDLYAIPKKSDWMIIDHYGLDSQWEKAARAHVKHVMAIDDMESRSHDCDVLLDQNIYLGWQEAYADFDGKKLLGPDFLLLRDEFFEARKKAEKREAPVQRLFVNMGGRDPNQSTLEILKSLEEIDFHIDVVMGVEDSDVKSLCEQKEQWHYHENPHNMADLMLKADLAIGAGGSMTWERCTLGLPTIIIPLVEHQEAVTHHLVVEGLAMWCNLEDTLKVLMMIETIQQTGKLSEISQNCLDRFQLSESYKIVDVLEEYSL